MIVCQQCDHHNEEDDTFCGSCGAFLAPEGDWAPSRGAADPSAADDVSTRAAQPRADAPMGPASPTSASAARVEQTRAVQAGDRLCAQCGEGNEPERRFCRRCGTSLAGAAVAGAAKDGGSRKRTAIGRTLALLGVVAITLVSLGPCRDDIGDTFGGAQPDEDDGLVAVVAVLATADSAAAGRGPDKLIDGLSDTAWAEGAPGLGEGQRVTVNLAQPTDVDLMIITPGAGASRDAFRAQPRPREVVVRFSNAKTTTITLKDQPGEQSFSDLGGRSVTWVQLEIVSVFPGAEGTGEDTSIAEVQLFRNA